MLRLADRRRRTPPRRGTIVVLAAFMMIVMMAMLAFAIDLGLVLVARDELQRTADSAAIAAAWELIDEAALSGTGNETLIQERARQKAELYASLNPVLQEGPGLSQQNVEIGYLDDLENPASALDLSGDSPSNAVHVTVQRNSAQNGAISLLFARAFGMHSADAQAEATAAVLTNLSGFQTPSSGGNIDILPFALDVNTWDSMMAGGGSDNFRWNSELKAITNGADGVREVNLYPQGTGSPGNRGTVDIGGSNNSTADIARQILYGVSAADLAEIGGKLELDDEGKCYLNGDTGISAGVKDELAAIKGQPRIIPLFTEVHGPGNNAVYTIVRFVGVRILDVKLTGSNSSKRVIIQPAPTVARGGIPSGTTSTSQFVYSPARLVR